MKKILLDCRFWGPSHTGLGRYTQELVTAIMEQPPKFKLQILAPKKVKGIDTIVTKIKPYSYAEQYQLPRLIREIKPDLTHFLHFNLPLSFKGKFMVTIHDLIKHHSTGMATTTHWPWTYYLKRLGYHLVMKQAVARSEAVLVPSRWVKQDILKHYRVAEKKIMITPEAAGSSYFKTTAQDSQRPLPGNYFIYVGNAYPHKNIVQLIKAMEIIAVDNRQLKLIIVTGRDWFYQHLRRQINRLKAQGVVKLKDFTSDIELRSLYHHSIAFVTASFFEGFGLPGLEAMAARTLVVASRRSALPETYSDMAEYFDPEKIEDLVGKLRLVLQLTPAERQKRLDKAYRYCRQFSWEKTAKLTLKAYDRCLGL